MQNVVVILQLAWARRENRKCNRLPFGSFDGNKQTPIRNRVDRTINIADIMTAYPSRPMMENGFCGAGCGGATGHVSSQSTQAHGNVLFWWDAN